MWFYLLGPWLAPSASRYPFLWSIHKVRGQNYSCVWECLQGGDRETKWQTQQNDKPQPATADSRYPYSRSFLPSKLNIPTERLARSSKGNDVPLFDSKSFAGTTGIDAQLRKQNQECSQLMTPWGCHCENTTSVSQLKLRLSVILKENDDS